MHQQIEAVGPIHREQPVMVFKKSTPAVRYQDDSRRAFPA